MAQVVAGPWIEQPVASPDDALDTLARVALVLEQEAREHKRQERRHRRSAQQVRQALDALMRDAEEAGYPIDLTTTGVAH